MISKFLKIVVPAAVCLLLLQQLPAKWKNQAAGYASLAASYLTDPLANAHELHRQSLLIDIHYPQLNPLQKKLKKTLFLLTSSAHGFFATFTTLPAIELRALALYLQQRPFIHYQSKHPLRPVIDNCFSMLSWNVCCVSGGYSITQGGVMPWRYRLSKLVETIRLQNADIVCLYEVFDIQTARALASLLDNLYADFYYNIGSTVIGLSSGLFVASKYPIQNAHFMAFNSQVDGDSQYLKKGFFCFDLPYANQKIARIITTHLNHSEFPNSPHPAELAERRVEMDRILAHIKAHNDAQVPVCVVSGDLNMDEQEIISSYWHDCFDRGVINHRKPTWGGDRFCCGLLKKPTSSPLTLDHTFLIKHPQASLIVHDIDAGFEGELFITDALSDHNGLLSRITYAP